VTLHQAQVKFTRMLALLFQFAYMRGYEITLGEGYRSDHRGHMKDSLHYIRLAQDINLFRNGIYLTHTEDYKELGEFWESIGGAWGGRFGAGKNGLGTDGNHFSFAWDGRK